jgi:phosphotransferase system  glucose/maltose/N-acetylglucosamine-specific IIC component
MVLFIECIALVGLLLVRQLLIPKLRYHEGTHEAVSGTVQAIGVFYGITVGLIAVAVWNTNSNASELVSKEAASIASLYRDVSGYPSPIREELRSKLRAYTEFVINEAWPAQREGRGQNVTVGVGILNDFQAALFTFEPNGAGQAALHNETLRAFNQLVEYRRLRIDAVSSGLSTVMWVVIWVGAIISIGVAYFYNISDVKLHAILVSLMAAFLAMVLFMIVINDKPFYGYSSISSDPYKLILENQKDVK